MDPSSRIKEARKAAKTAEFLIDVACTRARDPHLLVSAIGQLHAAMEGAVSAALIIARRQELVPTVPSMDRYREDMFRDVLVKERGFRPDYAAALRTVNRLQDAVTDRHVACDADSLSLNISTDSGSVPVSRDELRGLARLARGLLDDVEGMI